MQCVSIKKGVECGFMTAKGCTFNGGRCHPIVDQCQGCSRTVTFDSGTFCTVAPDPSKKWNGRPCNFATHVERSKSTQTQKLNPLKASKRAAANKG